MNSFSTNLAKKKQGELKSNVQAFGKLILSWQSDEYEIHQLLVGIEGLRSSLAAVSVCSECSLCPVFSRFEDLSSRLRGAIARELEDLFRQLRLFWFDSSFFF